VASRHRLPSLVRVFEKGRWGAVTNLCRMLSRCRSLCWVVLIGRMGFVGRGAVYLIVGWPAVLTAARDGGSTTVDVAAIHNLRRIVLCARNACLGSYGPRGQPEC